jgi:hypothetical protein
MINHYYITINFSFIILLLTYQNKTRIIYVLIIIKKIKINIIYII